MGGANKKNAILERWAATLARRRAEPAVWARDGGIERTFEDIEAEAGQWTARLIDLGGMISSNRWEPGSVIGIQAGNLAFWPALILAVMRTGLIPVPLGPHLAAGEREAALAACDAVGLITERLDVEPRPGRRIPGLAGCDFLKLTSGTTSKPRGILFTAGQLVADCDQICETMDIRESDLNFGVIPFSHSYGFSNLITPLLCRGVPLAASEERMPRAILRDLERTGATVFPGMPILFEKLAGIESGPLPALRLCISAGAPLAPRTGEAFTARFLLKIHSFYGSSECGGIGYDAGEDSVYEEGFVGKPMRGVGIVPAGSDGRIEVRSAAVGAGYFPEPDSTVLGGGRFIPGDLVRLGDRGMYLSGRATDIINIAGRKLNPAEVEARLAQCPGVREVVVFGVASALRNEEAVACVSGNAAPDEVLRFARTVLSAWQVPKEVWHVPELPVNERGKISRRELARVWSGRHA